MIQHKGQHVAKLRQSIALLFITVLTGCDLPQKHYIIPDNKQIRACIASCHTNHQYDDNQCHQTKKYCTIKRPNLHPTKPNHHLINQHKTSKKWKTSDFIIETTIDYCEKQKEACVKTNRQNYDMCFTTCGGIIR